MSHLNDDYDDWADRGMGRLSSMLHHPSARVTEPWYGCDICGEPLDPDNDEQAEMFNPNNPDAATVICHAQCGLNQGMEIA
jgi:hypothetical protein